MSGRVVGFRRGQVCTAEPAATAALPAVRLGKIVRLDLPHGVWVEHPGQSPCLARLAVDCTVQRLRQAIAGGQSTVLGFEDGDRERPIVLGIVGPPREDGECETAAPAAFEIQADADGRRVRLRAREEIVLQCGESSISLKRDGRVLIRGAYVETNATTTNRIKGGNVRIN